MTPTAPPHRLAHRASGLALTLLLLMAAAQAQAPVEALIALSIVFQEMAGNQSDWVTKWMYATAIVNQVLSPLLPVALQVGQIHVSFEFFFFFFFVGVEVFRFFFFFFRLNLFFSLEKKISVPGSPQAPRDQLSAAQAHHDQRQDPRVLLRQDGDADQGGARLCRVPAAGEFFFLFFFEGRGRENKVGKSSQKKTFQNRDFGAFSQPSALIFSTLWVAYDVSFL